MAKKEWWNDPVQLVSGLNKALGGKAGDWGVPGVTTKPKGGGGGGVPSASPAPAQHKAGVSYDPDTLIRHYLPGLNDQQVSAIREQLKGTEGKGGPEYHTALNELVSQNPNIQQHTALAQAFPDSAGGAAADPLASQMFFFKTIAPYLNQIRSQTQQETAPLYQQAMAGLPAQYKQSLAPFIQSGQAAEQGLQGALAGAAASGPSLDALMSNVTSQRQAAEKDYYRTVLGGGAAGSSGTDLATMLQLGVKQGG